MAETSFIILTLRLRNCWSHWYAQVVCIFTLVLTHRLLGTPIAGALLSSHFTWWRPVVFGGVSAYLVDRDF